MGCKYERLLMNVNRTKRGEKRKHYHKKSTHGSDDISIREGGVGREGCEGRSGEREDATHMGTLMCT